MKELPKMYRNKIEKEINNNEKIYSTIYNHSKDIIITNENRNIKTNNKTIEQKIAEIFNSPKYIYKIDVEIITDKDKQTKRIVGKTKTNLITMDNEYIPINTIRDIFLSK